MFIGYPEGVKGYKFWCLEAGHKRCLISRDVVFKEEEMAMKCQPTREQNAQSSNMQIEVEDATGDSTRSKRQEDATEEESDLRDYQLARDRQRRESRPPSRFGYADFIAYALTVAEEVDSS